MPHYKCGTKAKVGDRCKFKTWKYEDGKSVETLSEGVVAGISPGSTTCNAQVAYPAVDVFDGGATRLIKLAVATVTLGECERAG